MGSKILAGRYELIEKIGDGGMAVVYKAKDRLLNRFVAIKILKPEYIRDPKFIDSFRRESQASAGLSHPNIVSVYDVGKEGNIYYIVMEVLEGDTLSDVIRQEGRLDEMRAIDIAKQVAMALSTAHKKNIIHRDVKPHNILMSEDGTAKIADFGIAKAVNSGTIVNNTSTVMGSVHYLSPEQARGGYVDARSDIYSLGIVMYEMLTGSVPFDGENPVSVAMMHMNEEVPAPSASNPSISPAMDSIVLKATSKHQPDRYRSADELYQDLVQAEKMILAQQSGIGSREFYTVSKDQKKNRKDSGYSEYDDDDDGILLVKKLRGIKLPSGSDRRQAEKPENADRNRDDGRRDQKNSKKSLIIPVILALICALPLSILIYNVFGGSGGDTVEIPDIIGMTEQQAASVLEKEGLEYTLGIPVISEEFDAGEVVSTDPAVGREVKKGYTVRIILSKGKDEETVRTPNIVGKPLEEAQQILEDFDLQYGSITYDENSNLPEGTVISQDPDAGEDVKAKTVVNLVVSSAKKKTNVPDVIGISQSSAENFLKGKGLELGTVDTRHSDDFEEGLVIEQNPKPSEEVAEGTAVNIVISLGPEKTEPVLVSIPLTIDYSSAENEVFILTVTVTDSEGLHYIVNNQQRVKSDGSEQVILTGIGTDATVRVLMDNEIVSQYTANFETGDLN